MLSDAEEGSNLILTRLTPVATLIDNKQQSATTSFSTQVVTFSCHLWNRRDARVIPMPKKWLLGKRYQRNQIYLHWRKQKILLSFSVAIT